MTYLLLVIPALGLVVAGWGVRRRSVVWGQILIVIGCLGGLGAMGWQLRETVLQPATKVPDRSFIAVSFYLCNQAQQDLAGQSGSVLLLFPPASVMDEDTTENFANTFRAPFLRGHPEWDVQTVTLPAAGGTDLPLSAFKDAVAKSPNALAYICFAPVPADIQELFPPTAWRPFYVYDEAGKENWLTALKQRHIRSVIVPRPGLDPATRAAVAGHPVEIFRELYLMATPANADQVAAQLKAAGK